MCIIKVKSNDKLFYMTNNLKYVFIFKYNTTISILINHVSYLWQDIM